MLLLVFLSGTFAQKQYLLQYNIVDKDSSILQRLGLKTNFTSAMQRADYVNRLAGLLEAKGYISASVDSIMEQEPQTKVHLFIGEAYRLADLKVNESDQPYINQVGFKLNTSSINFVQYFNLQQKLLDLFENTGYPFARINLDSLQIQDREVKAILNIDKGIFYKVDSIRVRGAAKISDNFIHRYLNIEKGSFYSQQKFSAINQRILELPYLQQVQPWDVTMLNTGSIVNLYLQPKKSNQINILAGFLPDNQQLGGGKLLLTVDANLQLKNAFGSGESIGLVWQQIQPKSPRIDIHFQQPYLFKSPFGIDFTFNLFKKDSIFLNLNAAIGLRYMLSVNNSAKLSIRNQVSNVLQVDTFRVKSTRQLPDVADVSSINLGVDYEFNNTDYRLNPRKGNELNFYIGVGNKKVRKNNQVVQLKDPNFNFNTLYDSIKLNTYQVRVRLNGAHYFKLGAQSTFKTGLDAGVYESPNNFRNELFQIGGYKLLRGFDEESIFANKYGVATFEYRFLLGLNAYFFGFSDIGWSRYRTLSTSFSNTYLGGGIGLALETKSGIFNISYAAGKRNDLRFNIREAKIHIGFTSFF